MKTKIIAGMSDADYHSTPDLSASGIKLIDSKTPLHFWDAYINPDREPRAESAVFAFGKAWHCAMFEPSRFTSEYAAWPDEIDRKTILGRGMMDRMANPAAFDAGHRSIPDVLSKTSKEGKALIEELALAGLVAVAETQLAEIKAQSEPLIGKTIMAADALERVRKMREAVAKHARASALLAAGGIGELSIFWTDEETGAPCKIRPDFAIMPCAEFPNGLLIDGKTCEDASPEGFGKAIWSYGYHIQQAHYCDGFQQATGSAGWPEFLFLAQEKNSPFACAMYRIPDAAVQYGLEIVEHTRRVYAECMETGIWWGYEAETTEAALPGWALRQIEGGEGEVEVAFVGGGE